MRFLFGDYVLDTARRESSRGGEQIALEPQVFDLLVYLLQNRERVVSRDDLLASVWGGRIVSDATLDSRIAAARRAIGDSGGTQTLIRTFARKGVRFVGEVRTEAKPVAFAPEIAAVSGTAARPRGASVITHAGNWFLTPPAGKQPPTPSLQALRADTICPTQRAIYYRWCAGGGAIAEPATSG